MRILKQLKVKEIECGHHPETLKIIFENGIFTNY